jgi:NADH:quinone reductase (non-electrogenic)
MLGIQHPIIQGGMHLRGPYRIGRCSLYAGRIGLFTGLTQCTQEALANVIKLCHEMIDLPFDVNLTI